MNIGQLVRSDRISLEVLQEIDDAAAKLKLKKKCFVQLKSDSDVMKQENRQQ